MVVVAVVVENVAPGVKVLTVVNMVRNLRHVLETHSSPTEQARAPAADPQTQLPETQVSPKTAVQSLSLLHGVALLLESVELLEHEIQNMNNIKIKDSFFIDIPHPFG